MLCGRFGDLLSQAERRIAEHRLLELKSGWLRTKRGLHCGSFWIVSLKLGSKRYILQVQDTLRNRLGQVKSIVRGMTRLHLCGPPARFSAPTPGHTRLRASNSWAFLHPVFNPPEKSAMVGPGLNGRGTLRYRLIRSGF